MNAAIVITQFALQYGIPAAEALVKLFEKPSPSTEDWLAVFALARTPYEDYIAGTVPPAGATPGRQPNP